MIYICIPVFNRVDYTRRCLQSIRRQSFPEYGIIICDDGSTDGTGEIVSSEFPEARIIRGDGSLWWTGGTNRCVEAALAMAMPGDFIFTLNNDTELATDTLQVLYEFASGRPDSIVACGNYFNNDHNRLEGTAFVARGKWPFALYHKLLFPWGQDVTKLRERIYEVSSVSGKGVLIPVRVFRDIGLYNAEKLPHYHGDTEFTRRAVDRGYKLYLNLNAVIYTDQTASGIGQVNSRISLREFIRSFRSMRSENYLPSLYNRARLIYGWKWPLYLAVNVLSIILRFCGRYIRSLATGRSLVRPEEGQSV